MTKLVHELQVHEIELEMQNEELRASRAEAESLLALYSELYDFAPVGYFTLDSRGAIRRANLTGARLLDTDRVRLVDQRFGAFLAASSLEGFNAALSTATRGSDSACEVELVAPNVEAGGAACLQLTLGGATGGEARVVAVDVTQRKRTEELLRRAQKLEAIGRLAGGVAHEFNNLLTVILGGAEALRLALDTGTPPDGELLLVTSAAERAATLTRQLLAFGRKQLLRPSVVDVNELTARLADLFRSILGERIELVLSLARDVGPIEIDPVQLEEVILRLVIRAQDAMPEGGQLTVSTAQWEAGRPSAVGKEGPCVVITVRDTGVGMDSEAVAHVFEPFFPVAGLRTGLELASAAGIVEQCGGEITVHSHDGGTTFDIYLPQVFRSEVAASLPPVTAGPRGGAETVLFVDDEEALRRISKRILESAGYTVLLAGSGTEVLEVLERHRGAIHLLISDIVMPGMNGPEIAAHVRKERPETVVLFMSGYADDMIGDAGVLGQEVHFLGKPYTGERLKAKVREVLDS